MESPHDALIVFMRYPEPGKVKTRLAEDVGPIEAASIYEKLLRRTLGEACEFAFGRPRTRVLLFHPPEDPEEDIKRKFSGPWEFHPQDGSHLGQRMNNALKTAFSAGAKKCVLIGSDLADIESADLEEAFRNIHPGTVVLGPAMDGGFFLVGLDRLSPAPFEYEEWGTDAIFSRTVRDFQSAGFRVHCTKQRSDIDRSRDLPKLHREFLFRTSLSVIVPTLREPEKLAPLLSFLEDCIWPGDEIIVVQGGANEVSVREISSSTKLVRSKTGRGIQQNTGAILANGDMLFFLHDDSIPPADFPYLIRKTCKEPRTAIGCFSLAFSPTCRALDLIAQWANLRTILFGRPYGDQGLFCRRDVFEKVGGFQHRYLLEDVDLVRNCRKFGKPVMLRRSIRSSSHRYLSKGILTASVHNHAIMLLSLLGCDEKDLYRYYYGPPIRIRP